MTGDPHETRLMRPGDWAEARATECSRGTYPRPEPGRYLEVDAIASRAKESADRWRLGFLVAALVAFLVLVLAFGVPR